jgi:hypothetical protein
VVVGSDSRRLKRRGIFPGGPRRPPWLLRNSRSPRERIFGFGTFSPVLHFAKVERGLIDIAGLMLRRTGGHLL